MKPVALLSLWKIKNSFRTLLTDPRKLIVALILTISIGFSLVSVAIAAFMPRHQVTGTTIDAAIVELGIRSMMLLLAIAVVQLGLGDGLLAFAMPDVDYLFPSPISRRVVLLYKLPALCFGGIFYAVIMLVLFGTFSNMFEPTWPHPGHDAVPFWVAPAALAAGLGTFLNLAMFVAIRFADRKRYQRLLLIVLFVLIAVAGTTGWLRGMSGVAALYNSPWIRWPFLPIQLASDVLLSGYAHRMATRTLWWQVLIYAASFIPMFASNANYYEQSIASTERVAAIRKAARGGYASLMASKASNYKRKSDKTYTIKPFGEGAMALFWAHLAAAAKRPGANFVVPCAGGALLGIGGAILGRLTLAGLGPVFMFVLPTYASIGFMATAKTASEAAVRRRELLAVLPIDGWQSVAANLGMPCLSMAIFCESVALGYSLGQGVYWAQVAFGVGVFFVTRLAARMVLQYAIVLGYPDIADKIQQLLAMFVYSLCAAPLLFFEAILCIPALLLHSVWLALIVLSLFEVALIALLLALAGRISDRAVATGEPVSIFNGVSRRTV